MVNRRDHYSRADAISVAADFPSAQVCASAWWVLSFALSGTS